MEDDDINRDETNEEEDEVMDEETEVYEDLNEEIDVEYLTV